MEHQSEVFTENLKPLLQARLQIQTTSMMNANNSTNQSAVSSTAKPEALFNLQVPSFKNDSMNSISVITQNGNTGNVHKIRKNLSQLAMSPNKNGDSHFFPNDGHQSENDSEYYGSGGAGSNGHNGHVTGYNIEETNQVKATNATEVEAKTGTDTNIEREREADRKRKVNRKIVFSP